MIFLFRGYFLPPDYMVTSTLMKQVYNEEKDWMKAKNVVQCNPPKYDERRIIRGLKWCGMNRCLLIMLGDRVFLVRNEWL